MTSRFVDNQDGSITDAETGLTWAREDSWQSDQKWVTWDEAVEHAQHLCNIRFAGNTDWRMPSMEEVQTLYDTTQTNQDKYGATLHLDPIFPTGPLPTVWVKDEIPGNDGTVFDFRNGETRSLYKSKSGRMAVRPVRCAVEEK